MTRTETAPDPIDQAAAAERLHQRLLELLQDPDDHWYAQPQIAAATVAAVLAQALSEIAQADPGRLTWIKSLLVGITDHVAAAVTPPASIWPQAGKWH